MRNQLNIAIRQKYMKIKRNNVENKQNHKKNLRNYVENWQNHEKYMKIARNSSKMKSRKTFWKS